MAVTKKKCIFFAFFSLFIFVASLRQQKSATLISESGDSYFVFYAGYHPAFLSVYASRTFARYPFLLHPPIHGGLFSTSPSPRVSAEVVLSRSLLAAISASIFRFVYFAGYPALLRPFPRHCMPVLSFAFGYHPLLFFFVFQADRIRRPLCLFSGMSFRALSLFILVAYCDNKHRHPHL
jgi:hypothetical protein